MISTRIISERSGPIPPSRARAGSAATGHLTSTILPGLELSDAHFQYFQDIARTHAGIVIASFKRSMVARRVKTRLNALKISAFEDYVSYLEGPRGSTEMQSLINALTTNKTEFFRENHHFLHLAKSAVPLLAAGRQEPLKRLRVWSAGCSTGEEPYSIAMTLQSQLADKIGIEFRILATDIDTNVLSTARSAIYKSSDVASWPFSYRSNYAVQSALDSTLFRMSPTITKSIAFKQLNLHGRWPMKGPFDVIFCRNVVIYFDREDQKIIFNRMADLLVPGGLLYCGHSESLFGLSNRFRAVAQSIYQRVS